MDAPAPALGVLPGCLLIFGHIADAHGRKRVFFAGSALLAAFTLACAFVKDELTLAVLRSFQDIGGAATIPASKLIHRSVARDPGKRIATPPARTLLPLRSSSRAHRCTWRVQFLLSAAIAFATLLAGMFLIPPDAPSPSPSPSFASARLQSPPLPSPPIPTTTASAAEDAEKSAPGPSHSTLHAYPPPPSPLPSPSAPTTANTAAQLEGPNSSHCPRDTRTDYLGAFLSAAGLVLLLFVLGQGPGPGVPPPRMGMFGPARRDIMSTPRMGVGLEFGPRGAERALAYAPPPLLRPGLFTRARGRVGVVYVIVLLHFAAFMVWAFWLYYQVYIGYSPVRTVMRLTPMFVTGLICNVVVALTIGRIKTIWLLATGTLTTTIAPLVFALIIPKAPYWAFGFPAAVCSVVGADFLFVAGTLFMAAGGARGAECGWGRVSDYGADLRCLSSCVGRILTGEMTRHGSDVTKRELRVNVTKGLQQERAAVRNIHEMMDIPIAFNLSLRSSVGKKSRWFWLKNGNQGAGFREKLGSKIYKCKAIEVVIPVRDISISLEAKVPLGPVRQKIHAESRSSILW
ncbi:major facilitator superfamily domain-containing protein [Mycena epipterygia]|nr:major facilitator superfamily domain-containing protein [Mycena epipterygia]